MSLCKVVEEYNCLEEKIFELSRKAKGNNNINFGINWCKYFRFEKIDGHSERNVVKNKLINKEKHIRKNVSIHVFVARIMTDSSFTANSSRTLNEYNSYHHRDIINLQKPADRPEHGISSPYELDCLKERAENVIGLTSRHGFSFFYT